MLLGVGKRKDEHTEQYKLDKVIKIMLRTKV